MANMSYCRFENTLGDLADCVEVMSEVNYGNKKSLNLNQYEIPAFHRLAEMCREYLELYETLSENESNYLPSTDDEDY